MLARHASRLVRVARARWAVAGAREAHAAADSSEASAAAPGRAQVLRPPPGVDDVDFGRALKALSAQHQPLVDLPEALQEGIADWVTGGAGQSGRQLRHNSRRLLEHLRAHSRTNAAGDGFAPQEAEEEEDAFPQPRGARGSREPSSRAVAAPTYSSREVAAYAASRLPCTYAALHRVFSEVRACSLNLRVDVALTPARQLSARVPSFRPQTLLDFGSGPGTASLAVASMWPASLRESVAVEISRDMLELADVLRDSMNAAAGGAEGPHEAAPAAAPRAADAVPPSRVVPHLSRLNGRQQRRRYDIVVAAFSLGELPNEVARQQTVQRLWSHASDVLVIVEPGTPPGSAVVRAARSTVLQFEARKVRAAAKRGVEAAGAVEAGARSAAADGAASAAELQPEIVGAHVVAPCAHDKRCPMDGTDRWCHFSQRLQRPDTQRAVKGGSSARTYQDERFSYVVLRRGPRPSMAASLDATSAAATTQVDVAELSDDDAFDSASGSETDGDQDDDETEEAAEPPPSAEALDAAVAAASTGWSRLVRPPSKRSGHIILDLCTPAGSLQRITVAASHVKLLGPSSYRMARKARWGDAWPHPAVVRRTRIDDAGQWRTALEASDDSHMTKPRRSSLGEQHLE